MFKIESYVTPLILSYVDKYIKNIKPEDSQVSLWGGDAVFHNLDLRLDVLEAELQSPFSFSSGHIHELRIHVPWTKLASESIVITINTIECTLKLKNTEDRMSEKSSQSQKARLKRQESAANSPTPGYIQSLISKIMNNISIVCNNVILKYLEEDIVLSLNARSVTFVSVDNKWEPAFTELLAPELILRKLITVSDLTICLDQCNAQGKIPAYQEPLLYRCSLSIRMSSTYLNTKGIRASKVHLDWLFPRLDFSLSDQQVPMFIRLFKLAMALYLGDFRPSGGQGTESVDGSELGPNSGEIVPSEGDDSSGNTQSWAGWAWGYVPALLPVYWEEETSDGQDVPSERERLVRFGVYVERLSWTLKWTEVVREGSISSGASRLRFSPFLTLRMQGCFLEVTLAGVEWVDVQGGISHLTLEPSSPQCLCGAPEEVTLYFLQGCERAAFLRNSLYEPGREDDVQLPDRICHWEHHLQSVTEATILERTPALGFDYLYQLELPEENASEYLSHLGSEELEYSDLPERALFRLAVGPLQLKISYGFCHRINALLHAIHQYNYPDYNPTGKPLRGPQSADSALEARLEKPPSRTYQVAVLRPLVFISLSPPHPHFDLQRLVERRVIRAPSSATLLQRKSAAPTTWPVLKIAMTCADLCLVQPMYPVRLTLMALKSSHGQLFQQCHSDVRLKLHELSVELVTEERPAGLVKPCNASIGFRWLLLPDLWKDQPDRVLSTFSLGAERLQMTTNRAQLDYVLSMWTNLVANTPIPPAIPTERLVIEALKVDTHPILQLDLTGPSADYATCRTAICGRLYINAFDAYICHEQAASPIRVFLSAQPLQERSRSSFLEILAQGPSSLFQSSSTAENVVTVKEVEPVLSFKMGSFDIWLHPALMGWLNYVSPRDAGQQQASLADAAGPQQGEQAVRVSEGQQSNQSVCARDSGLSSSMDGRTYLASSSLLQSVKVEGPSSTSASRGAQLDWAACRRLLHRSIIHIDVQPSGLTVPADSEKESELYFRLPAVYVSCPHVRAASLSLTDLPFRPEAGSTSTSFPSSFPWTISFQHLEVSTTGSNDRSLRVLAPVSLKCTVALNEKIRNAAETKSPGDALPSIDLCIHIDMNAVEVSLNVNQLELLCAKTNQVCGWLASFTASTGPSGDKEEPVALPVKEDVSELDLGLWLQWAMPRFVLSLESPAARTLLDMEDVTSSVDMQCGQYAKLKSRLTAISIKMLTRSGTDCWVVEPATNGIVMSVGGEDITRHLQLDSRWGANKLLSVNSLAIDSSPVAKAASPILSDNGEAFQQQQSLQQQSQPAGPVAGGGGVLTLTLTRAKRQHVYSKWNHRRKSSTTEHGGATSEAGQPDSSFLYELAVAVEAVDLVVTDTLLAHVNHLTEPLRTLTLVKSGAEDDRVNAMPDSSHTLPLVFANSKGLRLFLADLHGDPEDRFLLFNLDAMELSPRVLNPIGRSGVLLKPDLYAEAEQSGLLFVPGQDVEDRQYQIDLNGLSFSEGCWKDVGQASWVYKTLNPTSSLHTMAENPALEWNARQLDQEPGASTQQPGPERVSLTPILTPCSLRMIFAPPIVSLEHDCVVAGQAFELSTSSAEELHLLVDIDQLDRYSRWAEALCNTVSGTYNRAEDGQPVPAPETTLATGQTCPSHSFITCGLMSAVFYRKAATESSLPSYLPYASVCLIQPHILLHGDKLELATYNIRLQLPCWADGSPVRSGSLPDENLFPINLLETRPGPPESTTGVPPSFLTIRQETAASRLSVNLGRPVKMALHRDNIFHLLFLVEQLKAFQLRNGATAQEKPETANPLLLPFQDVHVDVVQLVAELPLLPSSTVLTAGLSELLLDVNCQPDAKGERTEKLEGILKVGSLSVKADAEANVVQLCDPVNFDVQVQLVWPRWMSPSTPTAPLVHAFHRIDNLRVHLGPRQILVTRAFAHWLGDTLPFLSPDADDTASYPATPSAPAVIASVLDEQHYQDDLRTGAFNFQVRDTSAHTSSSSRSQKAEERPNPYQVVFNVQPASMCWAYPQPRALTRVDVYPIPLMKADSPTSDSGRDPSSTDGGEQVDCQLEYWDYSSQQFRLLRRFALSETRFTRVPLPSIPPASNRKHKREMSAGGSERMVEKEEDNKKAEEELLDKQIIFSDLWRIVMHFNEGDIRTEGSRPKKIIAAPPSLVACTRVDSYFNAALVPTLQLGVTFNHFSLTFHNQLTSPIPLGPAADVISDGSFLPDGAVPLDFPFGALTLNQTAIGFRCNRMMTNEPKSVLARASLDVTAQLQASLINFQYLVEESVLEPTTFEARLALTDGEKTATALLSSQRTLDVNLSQCTLHAMTACLSSWSSLLQRDSVSDSYRPSAAGCSIPLFTHYIVRNDTLDVLRFGQVGTGESIPLLSRRCHQYAWKVMGRKNRLQGCTEAGRWRWCQPTSVDRAGTIVRLVTDPSGKTVQLPLIWTVRSLNSLQKEVTVRGQVQVANLLPHALEVKLLPVKSPNGGPGAGTTTSLLATVGEMRAPVPASSVLPSFVFPLKHLLGVKVRLPGNVWSGLIPLSSTTSETGKARNVLLVRVAQKDAEDALNLWCHLWTEKVDQLHSRLLILLAPLYIVRSYLPNPLQLHLRTPGLNSSQHSVITGRGQQSVLDCPGTVDHGHQLSFQLSSDLPESTPPVPLSWTMASQYTHAATSAPPQAPFIDALLEQLFPQNKERQEENRWPFTSSEEESWDSLAAAPQQPKTDVRVTFCSLNARCHSLLVELKPWALLVNQSGADLLLRRTGDDQNEVWSVPNRSVMAPPAMSDCTFQLGLSIGGGHSDRSYFSPPLLLQDADHYRFMSYRPKLEGTVPLEGYCPFRIIVTDENVVCFLTLSSRMHDGIRILCVHPAFRLRNETDSQLKGGCFLAGDPKDAPPSTSWRKCLIQPRRMGTGSTTKATPLLFWQLTGSLDRISGLDAYVSLRLCSAWSCPVRIPYSGFKSNSSASSVTNPQRHSLSVPLSSKCTDVTGGDGPSPVNCPFILSWLEQNGAVYLTVAADPRPTWVIINRIDVPLVYAQASDTEPGQPDSDCPSLGWDAVTAGNIVKPNNAAFYTPPWCNKRYPDISPPVNLPRLLFAIFTEDLSTVKLNWSHPVHPSHAYDQFLSLSPDLDVMVRIVRMTAPNQTAIHVEPVSRVEISAKDVRGRISAPLPPPLPQVESVTPVRSARVPVNRATGSWGGGPFPTSYSPGIGAGGDLCTSLHHFTSNLLKTHPSFSSANSSDDASRDWNASVYFPELSFCFRDDTRPERSEVVRVTADHLLMDYHQNRSRRTATVRCGHLQVDNQMFRRNNASPEGDQTDGMVANGFDFPVVLLAQHTPEWAATNKRKVPLTQLLENVRGNAMVTVEVGLSSGHTPSTLLIQLEPIFLFIEDHFLFALVDYFGTFSLQSQHCGSSAAERTSARRGLRRRRSSPAYRDPPGELVGFPVGISDVLSSSLFPAVNLEQIVIQAMSLDLSLRSSVKMYIALDHSPLRLDAFERSWVTTTSYRLGQTLAMHYVASALFKAGWVVGSLELLGSPTALARTVSLGLKDFVRLPYQGIFRGPRGFVAGIINGSTSLVSHVTAGTVTSVTQLASSVARNVDRLSFDSDFQQRSEEGRRKKPHGLVQGISWGLSALGLSLLGALGGLAHHPLSSLMEEGTVSPRDLAVGLTKGIVGVVAKPISGAADLVAQTGQGLLSSTQLSESFAARRPPVSSDHQLELFCSGTAKVLWKLTDEAPPLNVSSGGQPLSSPSASSRLCCCLEAMRARVNDALPIRDQLAPVVLVVSAQNLCVLNAEDGELQVVLDLTEVDCWAHRTDPTLVLVRPIPLSPAPVVRRVIDDPSVVAELGNPHYDHNRVYQFVRQTTPFVLPESAVLGSSTDTDGSSQLDDPSSSSIATLEFFLNPSSKDFLLQCFRLAKQQRKGFGFALI